MIEVIYKEDTTEQEAAQESFSMPRNVRQIGLANGDYRIYIEEYFYKRCHCSRRHGGCGRTY